MLQVSCCSMLKVCDGLKHTNQFSWWIKSNNNKVCDRKIWRKKMKKQPNGWSSKEFESTAELVTFFVSTNSDFDLQMISLIRRNFVLFAPNWWTKRLPYINRNVMFWYLGTSAAMLFSCWCWVDWSPKWIWIAYIFYDTNIHKMSCFRKTIQNMCHSIIHIN